MRTEPHSVRTRAAGRHPAGHLARLKFWLHSLLLLTLVAALSACGGGDGGVRVNVPPLPQAGAQGDSFVATLGAGEAVGAPQATASVIVDPDTRRMVALVTTAGMVAHSVTLRELGVDAPGQAMAALLETPAGSGVWTTTAGISEAQLERLRGGQVELELSAPQTGALRGILLAMDTGATSGGVPAFGFGDTASGGPETQAVPASFAAALRGTEVVPPTPSVAHGSGNATLNPANGQITVALATAGMAPTSAAVREGAGGETGPVILQMAPGPAGSEVWLARGILSAEQLTLLANGRLYLSVQSAAYPEGELRGQLLPRMGGGAPAFGGPPVLDNIPPTGFGSVPGTAPGGFGMPSPGPVFDPFGGSVADPFGGSVADPFGGSVADPFGGSVPDPFGGSIFDPLGGAPPGFGPPLPAPQPGLPVPGAGFGTTPSTPLPALTTPLPPLQVPQQPAIFGPG